MRTGKLRDERGATLLEMVVVVSLLTIVLGGAFGSLASFQKASRGAEVRLENLTEAQLMVDTLTRDIRTATRPADAPGSSPFLVARPREASFYANLQTDGGPKLVTVSIDGNGILRERVIAPTGTTPDFDYDPNDAKDRLVGSFVMDGPIFEYYDDAGQKLPSTGVNQDLAPEDLVEVKTVRIKLSVKQSQAGLATSATTVETTVRLPNVAYNPMDGQS